MSDIYKEVSFSMPVTATLKKSADGTNEQWLIEGLASTGSLDQQSEKVLVKGIDLSYIDKGMATLNYNHRGDSDPSAVVGVITSYERTPNDELYIRGKLLKSLPKAQAVKGLMEALAVDAPERKMGMSIEGKVLQRNGNQIVKSWLKAVALTMDPVNPDTYVNFAKSMSACTWAPETDPIAQMSPVVLEEAFAKALSSSSGELLLKELSTTSDGGGTVHGNSPLMPEDLEKDPKDTGYAAKKHGKRHKGHKVKEKTRKSLTYIEARDVVKSWCPTVSDAVANTIVNFTFARLNQED